MRPESAGKAAWSPVSSTNRVGPQIIADADYLDAPVVFPQYCCPNCWTALYSAMAPA
jgi:hypothetical protein